MATGRRARACLTAVAAMALVTMIGQSAPASSEKLADASRTCATMTGFSGYGLVVEKAELVVAGPAPAASPAAPGSSPPPILPEHCLVEGTINHRIGVGGRKFGIGIELRMPTHWNGRFAFQGGSGMDGILPPAMGDIFGTLSPSALERGFAVVAMDSGHRGSPIDASFGLDQQARIDFAYNALDKATLAGKEMVRRYYGKAPTFSYMLGCSTGGRQGLTASQRLPLYFDGIVAGDPAYRFSRIALDELWNVRTLARIAPKDAKGRPIYSQAFSDSDLGLVKVAVLKQCDSKDGLADGLIHDWQACRFDPAVLTCKAGKTSTCLSADQVQALRDLHDGPRDGNGRSIYGPFNYDTGVASPAWRGMRLGKSPTGAADSADATLGVSQLRLYQLTPPDPNFDPLGAVDYDRLLERVRYTASLTDADSPFLGSFAAHGKMIVYNGLSDQGMASSELARWYEQVEQVNGDSVRGAVRLFLVPGMTHCSGGQSTDKFDMLDAIMDWVEKGQAPDHILATSRSMPGVSRPLCPYPTVARYKGGDTNKAESFTCS